MPELYSIPCKTQFTVREFEEYLFHRERVRVVIRTLLEVDKPVYPETMVGTSYFETRFRSSHNQSQDDNLSLLGFVGRLFKTTDVQEISVILGDGSAIDYVRRDVDNGSDYKIDIRLHADDERCFLVLHDVRSTYSQNVPIAA